jgi:hypothetical protein
MTKIGYLFSKIVPGVWSLGRTGKSSLAQGKRRVGPPWSALCRQAVLILNAISNVDIIS